MKEIHNCLVIGGDMRQIYMAEALGQAGFTVSLFGFEHLEETNHVGSGSCRDYYEALKGKDAVIFPLPLSRDALCRGRDSFGGYPARGGKRPDCVWRHAGRAGKAVLKAQGDRGV